MKQITTLAIVHQNVKVLLGMKKTRFGAGKFNGFGGKVKTGESIEKAAKRELLEECGIIANDLQQIGVITFDYQHKDQVIEMHLFKVTSFSNEPLETEEMKPQWFDLDKIPFDQMWPDDKYWMPFFLTNEKFSAQFTFSDYDNIIKHEIIKSSI